MPLGSAAMFIPYPWEWSAKYVDGNAPWTNFSKFFHVQDAHWWCVLELEVLTSYEDYSRSAVVRVNNTQVGTIEPRPTSRYQDLQAYAVHFSPGALTGPSPHTGPQTLEIDPVSAFDWLIVGTWRVFYNQQTP
jgi:hypothetical protein